ncbi:MAG: DNA repair protein RecN [Bacteroidales bacterium]|jgi:DNA repair protein RecN (Recombination protein N)|nr:DNA repair protein RecN [Bacteroidales bacterium]
MLQSLTVHNYALINELTIDFNRGLNIITGETGAGKSILMGALSLILGQRADTSVLKDKTRKCIVEAKFNIKPYDLKAFFEGQDLDYDDYSIIRREIADNGKSRAFINDTPVNLSVLKDLSTYLVDIHSQHESLLLGDENFQMALVDSFAGHDALLNRYHASYDEYLQAKSEYHRLINNAEKAKADLDYFQFQFDQLEALKLNEGEQEELEEELEKLNHAEEIKLNLSKSYQLLNEEEFSVILNLKEAKNSLSTITKYFKESESLAERIASVSIELQDISNEIERLNESVEYDPERIEFIRERLDSIYALQQKHKVATVGELLKIKTELENQIGDIHSYDFRTDKLQKELEAKQAELKQLAGQISENRKEVIPGLEEHITRTLVLLGMPNAAFQIRQIAVEEFLPTGTEMIKFMFSANKNIAPEEIEKVASGGEISRLMLSLKSILVENKTLPTIIFDEIDAGTSGEIADKMGIIIKQMSTRMQVINITHLPQIASKADFHYLVYKKDNHQTTNTYIRLLDRDERVNEIAKMLSGKELTDAAIENAKVLLGN